MYLKSLLIHFSYRVGVSIGYIISAVIGYVVDVCMLITADLMQHQNSANSRTLPAWECGGYFLFRSRAEFDQATEEAIVEKLSAVSLDDEGFQGVKQLCCSIADKLSS